MNSTDLENWYGFYCLCYIGSVRVRARVSAENFGSLTSLEMKAFQR